MPLFWLSLALMLGILAADGLAGLEGASGWGEIAWIGLGAGALLLWPLLRRAPWARLSWLGRRDAGLKLPPLLLAAAFALGGLRYAAAHPALGPADLAFYNGAGVLSMQGWVADDPDLRDQAAYLRVAVERVKVQGQANWTAVHGLAQVKLQPGQAPAYGDRLELRGAPLLPPATGDFSYRDYLARKGILSMLTYPGVKRLPGWSGSGLLRLVYSLRALALERIDHLFPAPENEFLSGILLGVDSGMSPALSEAFQATGTAHIIAISGFNMAILSALFMGMFGKVFSRWWAAFAAVLALAGYTLLAGAGASVVRAAIMCALAISAAQLGRSSGGFNALLLSAGVMCFFDPNLPWDVSFQLTFAATLGLMLYAGPLQGWFAEWAARRLPGGLAEHLVGPVGEYLLCTLAAQLTTLPLIVWHFGRLSLISLLANPLALPPQAPLMVLGALSVFSGLIWEPLGRLFALFTWPLAAYTTRLVEWLGQVPGGQITLGPDGALAVALICGVVIALAALREHMKSARLASVWNQLRPVVLLLGVGGLSLFAWRAALANPDGRLHLTVFDLEGGPAVLLRSPEGRAVLIGGAQSASTLELVLGRRLPPLGARLDGLVLSAASGLDGLAGTLEVIPAARVYRCVDFPALGAGSRLRDALRLADVPLELFGAERDLKVGGTARLRVVARSETACALELRMERLIVLLPGALLADELPPEALQPGELVLLGGQDPAPWREKGLRVLAPAQGGWLELQSDGSQLWVEGGK